MAYVETWDETKPAGSRDANLGDDDIREFKRAIRERLSDSGMYFPSTDDADAGKQKWLNFMEQSSNPSSASNQAFLFTKDVSGVTELYWMDSAGTVTQLTSGGKVLISSLVIASEARGDIITRGASAWQRVAVGANGKYLKSDGTDPAWGDLSVALTDLPIGALVGHGVTLYSTYESLGTTAMAYDDSKPTWAEGNTTTGLNITYTPKHASNYIIIDVEAHISSGGSGVRDIWGAVFQDPSGSDECLAAGVYDTHVNDTNTSAVKFRFIVTAGSTSSRTYKFRFGDTGGSTIVINGDSIAGARKLGGALISSVLLSELRVA